VVGGIIIAILLALAACLAAGGYIRTALDPFGLDREQMPELLIAFILAVGFLGLVVK
jgi:hypothetical protein